ncbi:MAG: acyl carrier protein [Actinomycetota bacterium]
MTTQEIDDQVRTVLVEEFKVDPETIAPESTFKKMGLDSLDMVSLVMSLEDRLGVEIPDGELAGIERLEQALDLLHRKVGTPA